MQFITQEWAVAYAQAWNNNDKVTKKLRKFSSVFKYTVSDRADLEPIAIEIENGVCTTFGTPSQYEKIEFEVSADTSTWKKAFKGKESVKKILKSDGFNFKGPKLKALSNKSGLEIGVAIMLEMVDVTI